MMSPSPLVQYQHDIVSQLKVIYPGVAIEPEWRALDANNELYAPRIDVAVGPFAIERREMTSYDRLMSRSRGFIESLINTHSENVIGARDFWGVPSFQSLKKSNRNSRCLLAIEIENEVSRKHLMGGAINAAALGRIGIVIGWTEEKFRALIKLRSYLNFLAQVEKNTFNTSNLLIFKKDQFLTCVRNEINRHGVRNTNLSETGL